MPPIFACTFAGCSAVFARDEHLTRHERTHSQERPFHCTLGACDKWFSRLDNVRQHVRIKHNDEAEAGERMLQEMSALRKRLSAEASVRRKTINGPATEGVGARLRPYNPARENNGRFASQGPAAPPMSPVLPLPAAVHPMPLPPMLDVPHYAVPSTSALHSAVPAAAGGTPPMSGGIVLPLPNALGPHPPTRTRSRSPPVYAAAPRSGALLPQYPYASPWSHYGEVYRVQLPPIMPPDNSRSEPLFSKPEGKIIDAS